MDCRLPASFVHAILQARILEWVSIPFSRESFPPRDQTQVPCIAGRFSTIWATREASNVARSWLCCNRMYMCVSCSVVSNSLRTHGLEPTRFLCPWDFPGKNTGVGFHSLLQGIFPTQGSNLGLVHCRQILYHLSHQGSQDKDPDMALWETQAGVMVL